MYNLRTITSINSLMCERFKISIHQIDKLECLLWPIAMRIVLDFILPKAFSGTFLEFLKIRQPFTKRWTVNIPEKWKRHTGGSATLNIYLHVESLRIRIVALACYDPPRIRRFLFEYFIRLPDFIRQEQMFAGPEIKSSAAWNRGVISI